MARNALIATLKRRASEEIYRGEVIFEVKIVDFYFENNFVP